MKQSQPLRIEDPEYASFGTSRTVNSLLWFVNSPKLEDVIIAYLAKYQQKYGVVIYAFVMQGNHYHLMAHFPKSNRAMFYRDFNARIAEAVRSCVPNYVGGHLFARRYSEQAVPQSTQDIEKQFFYSALQTINSGLCRKLSDYPGYNSFNEAISGIKRKVKQIDWAKYNATKRYNPNVKLRDFTNQYELTYSRIPGYENLSQLEYKQTMLKKLEENRQKIFKEKEYEKTKHRFMTKEELLAVKPGSAPKNTKTSKRYDPRPLVLTCCQQARKTFLDKYFSILASYKSSVAEFFSGVLTVVFPKGTYRPPILLILEPT